MYLLRGGARSDGGGPAAALLVTEPLRGLVDLAALLVAAPGLLAAPRGDGHGVLVFPGLLTGDLSIGPLRGFLRWLGYDARGWNLGRNYGPTEAVLAGLPQALLRHSERTGRPVSLIGWSLGGIYAREIARRHPRQVRHVITLGSPDALTHPGQSYTHGPYQVRPDPATRATATVQRNTRLLDRFVREATGTPVPPTAMRQAAARNPRWETVTLPGAGHTPQLEAPDNVIGTVPNWLGRITPKHTLRTTRRN